MRRLIAALAVLAVLPLGAAAGPAGAADEPGVYARVEGGTVVLGNDLVERRWASAPFRTMALTDKRTGLDAVGGPEFALALAAGEVTSDQFATRSVSTDVGEDAAVVTFELVPLRAAPADAVTVTRTVTVHDGVAGFRVDTSIAGAAVLTGYTLDAVAVPQASATLHDFRAGYDWRGSDTPDWSPQVAPFGAGHTGDHRHTVAGAPGEPVAGSGQWLSVAADDGTGAFLVLERVSYASSRMDFDGSGARALVDLRDDVVYTGPFEADVHVRNPLPAPVRTRTVTPLQPLHLETVFVGLAADADDEPWQYHRYLDARTPPWSRDVVFNSNGVDAGRISTGAKDDMDLAEVVRQASVARQMGVETFVLDDGWQAISGDWCPDSPQCPEPRGLYPDRFPDASFAAVREVLGDDMKLGLWMSPMHFNPASGMLQRNPEWVCQPVGSALTAYNAAQPNSSSNEAGLGTWNPQAVGQDGRLIDYIEGVLRHAITDWQVTYFKFDFLAWIDCAGADAVTLYEYRESFVAMLDRLIAEHPTVTFQIDETNDYRTFPFESVVRGPSWYANGNPRTNEALHNLWVLAPYVPAYTLGQSAFGDRDRRSPDYVMATALLSHMTFFNDLTTYTPPQVEAVRRWTDVYRAHRNRFTLMTYPLLEDPLPGDNWTALQPWDAEAQRGAVLVYRQDAASDSQVVALRGVRGSGSYVLTEALTGAVFGTFTADELRGGIEVALPERFSALVLLVDPA